MVNGDILDKIIYPAIATIIAAAVIGVCTWLWDKIRPVKTKSLSPSDSTPPVVEPPPPEVSADDARFLLVNELVGREREVGEVCEFWAAHQRPPAPLVWVSGPGGIGKTEFCKAVCVKLAGRKRQKVFVPMANLTTLEGFYGEVLKALGQDPTKINPGELATAAATALKGFCAHGIAYFDNAEDLCDCLDKAGTDGKSQWAKWIDGLRSAGVGVVVSSRKAPSLVSGERLLPVPMKCLSDCEARELFTAIWGRQPTTSEKGDYEYLIGELEGYPLAIVLVAKQARDVGYLDRKGWEQASAEVSRNTKHRNMAIALRTSWNVIRKEPQAVALWGVFHLSVMPLADKVLKDLFGGEFPNKGIGKLRSHGLLFDVTDGDEARYDMLNPIKQQFPALVVGGRWWIRWWHAFCGIFRTNVVAAVRERWLMYLRVLLPRADQTNVPQEERVPYEQECDAKRIVHGLLPQVWRMLEDLCANEDADAVTKLMNLAGNFFQQDVNSTATLEVLRAFFQGKPERREEFAYVTLNLGEVRRARSEYATAVECCSAAVALFREIDDQLGEANALNELGNVRRLQDEYDAAEKCYSDAVAIYRKIGNQLGKANALNGLGCVWQSRGEYDKAEKDYNVAVAIYKEIGDRMGEANTLRGLGTVQQFRGEYEKAKECFGKVAVICKEIGDQQGEANVLDSLGNVRRLIGEANAAVAYRKALRIFKKIGDRSGEIRTLWGLGAVLRTEGRFAEAEKCYRKSEQLSKELKNRSGEFDALWGLGEMQRLRGKYTAAKACYSKAMAISKTIRVPLGDANALLGLGEVCRAQGEYAEAEKCYSDAAAIYKKMGNQQGTANALFGVGFALASQDKLDEAEKTLGEAKRIAEQIRNHDVDGLMFLGSGEVLKRRKRWDEAEDSYSSALALFKDLKSKSDMADAGIGLGEVYEAKGDKAAALREFEAALKISKEIGYKWGCETAGAGIERLK